MRFWISKNSEVPIREQLTTQVSLGFASGELKGGDRLPSTREIARRYSIHPNTVAAAYQELVDTRILVFRQGSGYFIAKNVPRDERISAIDRKIMELIEAADHEAITNEDLISRILLTRDRPKLRRLLLIESEPGLQEILLKEIDDATSADISAISFEEFVENGADDDVQLAAFFDEKPKIEAVGSKHRNCFYLDGNSVSSVLSAETRPAESEKIAVVSGWDGFLAMARVMLTAAGIEPGNIVTRSTNDEGWKKAISPAAIVITDRVAALELPNADKVRVFSIVSESSLRRLSEMLSS